MKKIYFLIAFYLLFLGANMRVMGQNGSQLQITTDINLTTTKIISAVKIKVKVKNVGSGEFKGKIAAALYQSGTWKYTIDNEPNSASGAGGTPHTSGVMTIVANSEMELLFENSSVGVSNGIYDLWINYQDYSSGGGEPTWFNIAGTRSKCTGSTEEITKISSGSNTVAITGTVKSSTGTAISGATITTTSLIDNSVIATATSSASGNYSINVPYGAAFTISASATGFTFNDTGSSGHCNSSLTLSPTHDFVGTATGGGSPTPTPPSKPCKPTVTAGVGKNTVTWCSVTGATSYKVIRNGIVIAPSVTLASYEDINLTAGTQYCYKIIATNTDGDSPESEETCATPTSGKGSLKVDILPAGAVSAGAEWRISGGAWQSSGVTIPNLDPSSVMVEFKAVTGWEAPTNQNISIVAEQTAPATAMYGETPKLNVSPLMLNHVYGGEVSTINVDANFGYKVEIVSGSDFLVVGNATANSFRIGSQPNIKITPRTGQVRVVGENQAASLPAQIINITQEAAPPNPNVQIEGSINTNPSSVWVHKNAISVSVNLKNIGNVSWTGDLYMSLHKFQDPNGVVADLKKELNQTVGRNNTKTLSFNTAKIDYTPNKYTIYIKRYDANAGWVELGNKDIEIKVPTFTKTTSTLPTTVPYTGGTYEIDYETDAEEIKVCVDEAWARLAINTIQVIRKVTIEVLKQNETKTRAYLAQVCYNGYTENIPINQEARPCETRDELTICADNITDGTGTQTLQGNPYVGINGVKVLHFENNISLGTPLNTNYLTSPNWMYIDNNTWGKIFLPSNLGYNIVGSKMALSTMPSLAVGLISKLGVKINGIDVSDQGIDIEGEINPGKWFSLGTAKAPSIITLDDLKKNIHLTEKANNKTGFKIKGLYIPLKGWLFVPNITMTNVGFKNIFEFKKLKLKYDGKDDAFETDVELDILGTSIGVKGVYEKQEITELGVSASGCSLFIPLGPTGLGLYGGGLNWKKDSSKPLGGWFGIEGNAIFLSEKARICLGKEPFLEITPKLEYAGGFEFNGGVGIVGKLNEKTELLNMSLDAEYKPQLRQLTFNGKLSIYKDVVEGKIDISSISAGVYGKGEGNADAKKLRNEWWVPNIKVATQGEFRFMGNNGYFLGNATVLDMRIYYAAFVQNDKWDWDYGKTDDILPFDKNSATWKQLQELTVFNSRFKRSLFGYEEPLLAYRKGFFETTAAYQTISIDKNMPYVAVEGKNNNGMPDFSLVTIKGDLIDKNTYKNFTGVQYLEDTDKKTARFFILNPRLGYYRINQGSTDSIKAYQANMPPVIQIKNVVHDTANRKITVSWEDSDPDDNAVVDLFVDTDNENLDGKPFAENIAENDQANTYTVVWDSLSEGKYFVYATIRDAKRQSTSSYSAQSFDVSSTNPLGIPQNVKVHFTDTTVVVSWDSVPNIDRYIIYYANEPNTVTTNSKALSSIYRNYLEYPFTAGYYYEFMVASADSSWVVGKPSAIVKGQFVSSKLNNQPYISKNTQVQDMAYVGKTYTQQLSFFDADNDITAISLENAPVGMTISNTGKITWTPTPNQTAYSFFKVKVTDSKGAYDSLKMNVLVFDAVSAKGSIYFSRSTYTTYGNAIIEVEDRDFGNSTQIDQITVHLSSSTDKVGFSYQLTETSTSSGIFRGTFALQKNVSSAGKLQIMDTDTIFAKYSDDSAKKVVSSIAHFALLKSKFEVLPNGKCADDTIRFLNTSKGTELSYEWNFGDGNFSTVKNPDHVFKITNGAKYQDFLVTLKITDMEGNSSEFTKNISQYNRPKVVLTKKDISCNGEVNGEIQAKIFGNFPPYTVLWEHNNKLKTLQLKNLAVGSYKIAIMDSLGCIDSARIQITQPDSLFLTAIVSNVSKQGIKDAKINLVPRGGTAFSNGLYRYEWLLPDGSKRNTEDLDSLTSGKYEIVVTDSMGCASKLSVLVSEPDILSLKVLKFIKPSCLLAKDGYLEVQAEGGVPKYSFKSNTGDTASVQNGKIFIVKNIGVTEVEKVEIMLKDQRETAITQFFNLTVPTGEPAISLPKNEYCLTDQNPKISISGVQNGKLIIPNGLVVDSTNTILLAKSTAGKYKIGYQTSQSVCKVKDFELTIHGLPFNSLKAKTIFACDSAVLDAKNTGGTYLWSTGQTTQKITVFKDSSYTVKINIGTCQITDTIKVKLSKIQISVKTTEGDCTGKGGSAEITAKNGIGKYRYQWSHNSTINTNKAENLAAGNYTVKILDSLNCEKSIPFQIKTPKLAQKVYKNTTLTACNSIVLDLKNEGSLYKLNGKSSIQKPIIDKSGTYLLEIDNGECKILDTVKVVLSNIQIKTEQKNPVCSNSPDGFLKITAKDGIGKMSIRWNDDQTPNLWIRENLAVGNYTATITDSVGCSTTKTFTIEAPTKPLTATANVTGTTGCFGENNGEIRIMATGGLPPYKYFLNGQPSNALIKNVANGIFLITVQDSNKCSFPLRVLMYQSDAMQIQKTVKNSACADTNNGSITLKITGGYAPYKVEFTHGVSKILQENETFVLDNLAPRPNVPYEALITDAKGCAKTISEKITVAPKSKIRFLNEQTTLCKGEKALIKVKYEGSIYPFDLIYTDGQKQVELKNQIDSLLEIPVLAEKTVKIRLEKLIYGKLCEGEVDKKEFRLNVNDLPEIEKIEISDEKENRQNGEIIILMPLKKGKEPFSFSLDGKNFQDSLRFRKLKAGEYTLFIKDANNCLSTYPQKILIKNSAISFQGIHNSISPNQDGVNDTWEVPSIQSFPDAKITIFDRYGNLVFQTNTGQAWDGTQDGKELSIGTYFYLIEINNKQPVKGFIDLVR